MTEFLKYPGYFRASFSFTNINAGGKNVKQQTRLLERRTAMM